MNSRDQGGTVFGRTVGLIPARAGSRRLPGKNLRAFAGEPLIVWTIRAAREAAVFDRLLVSSDDEAILDVARSAGAEPLLRPPDLARDDTSSLDVVWHACESLAPEPDVLMLLQPTSPLRRAEDIRQSLHLLDRRGAPSVVSVTDHSKHREWTCQLDEHGALRATGLAGLPGRNVGLNGAIYAARIPWLREQNGFIGEGTLGYWMPPERSADIDLLEEFEAAERQFAAR